MKVGIAAEVIDLRCLIPLDAQAILRSVAKTSRLFTVEENPRVGGWGAEIVSIADPSRPYANFFGDEELFKSRTIWLRNIGLGVPVSPQADIARGLEGLRRQWACELGEHGIRVLTMRTGGIPQTLPQDFPGRDELIAGLVEPTLLRRAATLSDVGNVATFLASDLAASITSTEINISCGAIPD